MVGSSSSSISPGRAGTTTSGEAAPPSPQVPPLMPQRPPLPPWLYPGLYPELYPGLYPELYPGLYPEPPAPPFCPQTKLLPPPLFQFPPTQTGWMLHLDLQTGGRYP